MPIGDGKMYPPVRTASLRMSVSEREALQSVLAGLRQANLEVSSRPVFNRSLAIKWILQSISEAITEATD